MIKLFLSEDLNLIERTRAKTLVYALLFSMVASILFFVLANKVGSSFPYSALIAGVGFFLLLFKWTQSVFVVGNLTTLMFFVLLANLSLSTGGIYSVDLMSLFTVILFALVVLGYKGALFWCIPVVVFNVYCYFLSLDDGAEKIFRNQTLDFEPLYYLVINLEILSVSILLLIILDRLNNALITRLRVSNQNLDEVNRQLKAQTKELTETQDFLIKSNSRLKKYAHTVSHDLRQPARTISSFTQLLRLNADKPNFKYKSATYIEHIVEGVKRLNNTVEGLLRYSEKEQSTELISLNSIVEDVLRDLKLLIDINRAEVLVDELPSLNIDPTCINQVFQNLISNAIKYKRRSEDPIVRINCKELMDFWEFTVSDNGLGISNKNHINIFNNYEQLDSSVEGKGLGLATCVDYIEYYGGTIWVESTIGKGSAFKFTLQKNKV